MDVGRNLTLTSEQDSDNYDSKQQNASAGVSGGIGSFSASANLSQDKMHSTYDSVIEQTGVFAGKGGFDITVGEHTQLNGAVIGSTGTADKNRLDTGTLGFSDIENKAAYNVEYLSTGISTSGSIGDQFLGNMGSTLLVGVNGNGSDSSTTKSAISDGSIIIRDKGQQSQDVADLSRDVEHANQTLSPIFDKEKEQQRLQEAQKIGEIGAQVMDIARTQGDLNGLSEAKKKYPEKSAEDLRKTDIYKAEMAKYGTGSAIQQGLSAATAAIQGLAGGDMAKAIAGAASPYLAEVIHNMTTDPVTGKVNAEANLMAHAVVGAVVAQINGNSALAGASGAAMGEFIAQQLYPNTKREDLTEEQRQTISSLSTLAAGLAGGLTGDRSADAVAGAQAGKNSSENNNLSLPSGMTDYGQAAASWNQYAVDNNLTPEQTQAGLNRLAKGDLPEGANIAKAIVDGYVDGVMIAGAWYLGPAASIGKVVAGSTIGEIANGSYQWYDLSKQGNENKSWDYWGSASAAITGGLAPGRDIWANTAIAMGSTIFTDGLNGRAISGSGFGTVIGGGVGEIAPIILKPVFGNSSGFVGEVGGAFVTEIISNGVKNSNDNNQAGDKK